MPQAVSIVHVPGHQKGDSPTARGNRAADLAARKVADDFITPVLRSDFHLQVWELCPQPLSIHPQTLLGSKNTPTFKKVKIDGTETQTAT